jgi:excisionase family DNA binding protein
MSEVLDSVAEACYVHRVGVIERKEGAMSLLTVSEAAAILWVDRATVINLIADRKLAHQRDAGGRILIDAEDVERFRQER